MVACCLEEAHRMADRRSFAHLDTSSVALLALADRDMQLEHHYSRHQEAYHTGH